MRRLPLCGGSANDLHEALTYHLDSGGKRLRARLALTAAFDIGLDWSEAVAIATACELLHNASLVQDDLQDRDGMRRQRAAVWHRFGTNTALALTDLMISAAYRALADTDACPVLLSRTHDAVAETVVGQHNDLEGDSNGSLARYLRTAAQKSAPLFALALELPLLAAGRDDLAELACATAYEFALAYQIVDDCRDVATETACGAGAANAVLVLHHAGFWQDAQLEAARHAAYHADRARRHARCLPAGCRALLDKYLEQLGTGRDA